VGRKDFWKGETNEMTFNNDYSKALANTLEDLLYAIENEEMSEDLISEATEILYNYRQFEEEGGEGFQTTDDDPIEIEGMPF
jgi:hypothetical protein